VFLEAFGLEMIEKPASLNVIEIRTAVGFTVRDHADHCPIGLIVEAELLLGDMDHREFAASVDLSSWHIRISLNRLSQAALLTA
jgi:hypothetical protein